MYRILCDRMPARELGSGLTWFKMDGNIVEFATTEEAGAKVKELTDARKSPAVTYSAKEFNYD